MPSRTSTARSGKQPERKEPRTKKTRTHKKDDPTPAEHPSPPTPEDDAGVYCPICEDFLRVGQTLSSHNWRHPWPTRSQLHTEPQSIPARKAQKPAQKFFKKPKSTPKPSSAPEEEDPDFIAPNANHSNPLSCDDDDDEPIYCDICEDYINEGESHTSLAAHNAYYHDHRCDKCHASFPTGVVLEEHQLNSACTVFACKICGRKFDCEGDLNDHHSLRHGHWQNWSHYDHFEREETHEENSYYNRKSKSTFKPKENEPSLYDVLEISPHALGAEIKAAARAMRIAVHPDKFPGLEGKELLKQTKKAQEVAFAADILCDRAKREKYDAGEL